MQITRTERHGRHRIYKRHNIVLLDIDMFNRALKDILFRCHVLRLSNPPLKGCKSARIMNATGMQPCPRGERLVSTLEQNQLRPRRALSLLSYAILSVLHAAGSSAAFTKPGWRNRQTQRTQNPPRATSWGFDPPSRHQKRIMTPVSVVNCRQKRRLLVSEHNSGDVWDMPAFRTLLRLLRSQQWDYVLMLSALRKLNFLAFLPNIDYLSLTLFNRHLCGEG